MIRIAVGRQRRTRFGTPEAWHGSDRRRRPSFETPEACMVRNAGGVYGSKRRRRVWFETPEACMVRNAGGVACNSLGCKPQDVHPVIEPRRGGTNRNVLRHAKAPCRPSRARNIFLLADPGVCTPGYYVPPLQGSIPRIAIPPRFTRQSHLRKRIVRQTRLHATEEASGTHP
jgi:hypothetical protein